MANELADYLRPTTLLQGVNFLLEGVSSTPVSSLAAQDTNTDAEVAINRIGEASVELQTEGWCWNQDIDYEIAPDSTTGECRVPPNTVRFIQAYTPQTYRKRLQLRGTRLYDAAAHTYNIGVPVKGDITVLLSFEDLPPAARWYVTMKACRRFTAGKIISSTAFQFTQADENNARARMEQEAAEMEPETMYDNPHIRRLRRRRATAGLWPW